MGESLQDQVEAAIDEALSSGEWVDILVGMFVCLTAKLPSLSSVHVHSYEI